MCGGLSALVTAVEGAEDDFDAGYKVVDERGITENDCLLGITTSGMADYVHAALKRTKEIGGTTGLLVCNEFKKPLILMFSSKLLSVPRSLPVQRA